MAVVMLKGLRPRGRYSGGGLAVKLHIRSGAPRRNGCRKLEGPAECDPLSVTGRV